MSINTDPAQSLVVINNLSDTLQRALAPAHGADFEKIRCLAAKIEEAAYQIGLWADNKQMQKEEAEWEAKEAEYQAMVGRCNKEFGGRNGSL